MVRPVVNRADRLKARIYSGLCTRAWREQLSRLSAWWLIKEQLSETDLGLEESLAN